MTARRIFHGLPKAPTWTFHYAMHIMLKYYLQQIKWVIKSCLKHFSWWGSPVTLAVELLLNTCIVNSIVLFKQVTRKNIAIPDFRMKLAMYLMKCSDNDCISPKQRVQSRPRHEVKKMPGNARNVRRFCKACYNKNSKQLARTGAKNSTKKSGDISFRLRWFTFSLPWVFQSDSSQYALIICIFFM